MKHMAETVLPHRRNQRGLFKFGGAVSAVHSGYLAEHFGYLTDEWVLKLYTSHFKAIELDTPHSTIVLPLLQQLK
jgi:hypothetical protein